MDIRTATFILSLVTFLVLVPIAVGNWASYHRNVELQKQLQAIQSRVSTLEREAQEKRNMRMQRQQ